MIIRPRYAIAFADLFALLFLLLVLLPHEPDKGKRAELNPPGSLIVEIRWPDAMDVDIDLWMKAGKRRAVGYSNPHGAIFNLLRDDLGHRNDVLELNYENGYSRGVPDGDYAVTVHYYAGTVSRVPVRARIWLRTKASVTLIAVRAFDLSRVGEERTVARFTIKDGKVVKESLHELPIKLRAATLHFR